MTQSLKLTPKEWTILKLFIFREGFALESVKHNPRRKLKGVAPRDLAPDHFYSYPDDIFVHLTTQQYVNQDEKGGYHSKFHEGYVKDIHAVTIPTAGKACRKFVKLEIFEPVKNKRTEKKFQEITQYYLKSDFETFKIVLLFLMQNCDPNERVEILSRPYFRKIITEDLVRMRLFEKQVAIFGRIDIFDWAPNEIPKILSIFDEKKDGIFADFDKKIQNEIIERETDRFYQNDDASDWAFSIPFFMTGYNIPIFPEGMPIEERLVRLKANHPDYDTVDRNLSDAISRFPGVLNYEFQTIEQEGLILPILGLIQSSPAALAEFILGDWQSFRLLRGRVHKKDESFDFPLFVRLISLAISDMANTMQIPGNKNVDSFELREFSKQLTIDGEYCLDEGLLRIGLTRGYDIYYDMGYSTRDRKYPPSLFPIIEEKTPSLNKFWVKIRVRQVSPFFIRKTEIKDITLLLTLLRAKSQISNHIRGKLSNRMQNLLLRYENVNAPTSGFVTFLIEEINRTLLREDFYDAKAFSKVEISSKTKETIDAYYGSTGYDDDSTGSNYGILLWRNRFLLDDAFADAIARYGDVQYPIRKGDCNDERKSEKK